MNSGGQKAVARQVYSSLAPTRSWASARMRSWSKASGPALSYGTQRASAASLPPCGSGGSGSSAANATETTRIRGSRSGSL